MFVMNEMKRRIKASHCAVNCALTDRLGLEQLRGAALSFTLAINGRQLHLVAALRFQARYRHLVDEVCYNIRDGTVSVESTLIVLMSRTMNKFPPVPTIHA